MNDFNFESVEQEKRKGMSLVRELKFARVGESGSSNDLTNIKSEIRTPKYERDETDYFGYSGGKLRDEVDLI